MTQAIVVQTTTDTQAAAEKLAEVIVEQALGACVQITGPITSVYKWQGAIQKEEEFLVSVKTTEQAFTSLSELIRQHHSYDVPEVIALPICKGTNDYLMWVADQVQA